MWVGWGVWYCGEPSGSGRGPRDGAGTDSGWKLDVPGVVTNRKAEHKGLFERELDAGAGDAD